MRINSNISSFFASRTLAQTNRAIARSMARLASGQRINSANDDPAGLTIGMGLEAQRRGMWQSIRNMQDARGFFDTADGALSIQTDLLQRMRELALQAANGTLSDSDRSFINREFQSLLEEFNRITTQTEFNGVKLLDGSFGTKSLQVGTRKGEVIEFSLPSPTINATSSSVTGSGEFTAGSAIATMNFADSLTVGDLNGDNIVDFVSSDATNAAYAYLGNGDGTFWRSQNLNMDNGEFTIADFNGDTKADIAGAPSLGAVYVLFGNGDGTFGVRQTINSATWWAGFESVDLDGDTDLDLLAINVGPGHLYQFLNDGSGTFSTTRTTLITPFGYEITTGDFNLDGKVDAVLGSYTLFSPAIYLGNGDGTFQPASLVTSEMVGGYGVMAADLNGDGKLDLVGGGVVNTVGTQDWISVHIGNGNGTFQPVVTLSGVDITDFSGAIVDIGDLNDDGKLDIIRSDSTANTLSIYFGNGDGTFLTRVTYSVTYPENVFIADLTEDGVNDILVKGDQIRTLIQGHAQTSESASLDISTQEMAEDVLEILANTLVDIQEARSSVGALQSRLEFAQSNALNLVENISLARSEIMDIDYALELSEFTRLQILQQVGVAVLSQANLSMNLVLQLVRN